MLLKLKLARGKNANLITKKEGSFFFLAELIVDIELTPDIETTDHCGNCTACIDACPTQAITEPYIVDGSKCISYYTIELKEAIPKEVKGKFEDWIFGCDICQDVCPWNRHSKPHQIADFVPNDELSKFDQSTWTELTDELFEKVFFNSAIKRTKFNGLKRNIDFLTDN